MRSILVMMALLATAFSGCTDADFSAYTQSDDGDEHSEHSHGGDDHAVHGHDGDGHRHSGGSGAGEAGGDARHHGHTAGDNDQPGMDRPAFPPAQGSVPTAEEAAAFPEVSMLRLIGDRDLESSGYAKGNGTLHDPYVIEHLYVTGDLYIQDTDACFIIRETWIGGQLSLNWNGQCVHVHHNHIEDLRVNENIRRVGYATGGLMERNEILFVGQLRHYDGEFRHNTVGPRPQQLFDQVLETTPLLIPNLLVANIDGFNQGLIHNNTFDGPVDLDFHGHHHGDGFFAPHSHYHGDDPANYTLHEHDHTERWTSVKFVDNTIHDDEAYGLRYEDRNHAGDDRVARSEQEEELDLPHFHRSHIVIARNTVIGSGIWIDVFNADDSNHKQRNDGWLQITDNIVEVHERDGGPFGLLGSGYQAKAGIQVQWAKEVELNITGNQARFVPLPSSGPVPQIMHTTPPPAFLVQTLSDATLRFEENRAEGYDVGLRARSFDDVLLLFAGNDFGTATQPTDFDDSV